MSVKLWLAATAAFALAAPVLAKSPPPSTPAGPIPYDQLAAADAHVNPPPVKGHKGKGHVHAKGKKSSGGSTTPPPK